MAFASLVYVMTMSVVFGASLARGWPSVFSLWTIIRQHWLATVALGLSNGLHFLLIFVAFRVAPIAYIGGMKRLSIIIVAILGAVILREGNFRDRIVTASLVTIGAVVLAFDGQVVRLQDYVTQLLSR